MLGILKNIYSKILMSSLQNTSLVPSETKSYEALLLNMLQMPHTIDYLATWAAKSLKIFVAGCAAHVLKGRCWL